MNISVKICPLLTVILMKSWVFLCVCVILFLLVYWLLGGVVLFLSLLIFFAGIFYFAQDHLLFHPDDNQSRTFVQTPYLVDLPYENIFIKSLDGTLINLFFILQPEGESNSAPTLVFFHGNAGNMGHRLHNAAGLYCNLRCNILMVEYRGYGLSKGAPSESGLCKDAQAAIDFLSSRNDINHRKIIVFGRSLGGAVAIDLAARPEYAARIWCLILENTFTSIPDIAYALFRWKWLRLLPLFFYKNKFISKKKISSIALPTLFISGLSDALVPPSMMIELHTKCGSQLKKMIKVSAGGHNDTWTCPGYYTSITNFLTFAQDYLPTPPPLRSSISAV